MVAFGLSHLASVRSSYAWMTQRSVPPSKVVTRVLLVLALLALLALVGWLFIGRRLTSPYGRLMVAIDLGLVSMVKAELDRGTSPNILPRSGFDGFEASSPMCAAAARGNLEIVSMLVERGGDVNMGDAWNLGPLESAAYNGHVQVMELLINKKAKVNDTGIGSMALWRAAVSGHAPAVRLLLSHGANPNTEAVGSDGSATLLHHLNETGGSREIIEVLKAAGARDRLTPSRTKRR